MHFSTTLLALFPLSVAVGSPVPGKYGLDLGSWKKDWEHKWGNNEWKNDKKVFYFKDTYAVKADPSQVRNGTTSVPGQPGAKGFFKYGINVEENTICYVSRTVLPALVLYL